jgi:hypothetical protein
LSHLSQVHQFRDAQAQMSSMGLSPAATAAWAAQATQAAQAAQAAQAVMPPASNGHVQYIPVPVPVANYDAHARMPFQMPYPNMPGVDAQGAVPTGLGPMYGSDMSARDPLSVAHGEYHVPRGWKLVPEEPAITAPAYPQQKQKPSGRGGLGQKGKIFVGGLSPDSDAEKLRQHFGRFGTVCDASVIKDPTTKRSRGFGFVEFEDGIPPGFLDMDHILDHRRCSVKVYTYTGNDAPGKNRVNRKNQPRSDSTA